MLAFYISYRPFQPFRIGIVFTLKKINWSVCNTVFTDNCHAGSIFILKHRHWVAL